MKVSSRLISTLIAFVLIVAPVYGSSTGKTKTNADKVVQGTVVTTTDGNIVIRKGKSDMALMYDAASQKPAELSPGTPVLVHYRDEKKQHIATLVEVNPDKAGGAKAQENK